MKKLGRSSIGFWMLLLVYCSLCAFLLWGAITPRLEHVWNLEQALASGRQDSLSRDEIRLLFDVMADYPAYAKDLSGGDPLRLLTANIDERSLTDDIVILWSDAPTPCGNFVLDVSASADSFPITFEVTGETVDITVKAKQNGPVQVNLPGGKVKPDLLQIKRKGKKKASADVKVRLCQ